MPRFFVLPLLLISSSSAFKILALFPHIGKSHFDAFLPVFKTLAERGHELTMVSHFPQDDVPENYIDISLAGAMPIRKDVVDLNQQSRNEKTFGFVQHIADTDFLFDLSLKNCDFLLNWPTVRGLHSYNGTFDLILLEVFNSDCALGYVHKFKAPFVGLTSHIPVPWTYDRIGSPDNPSHVPNFFLENGRKMTFAQRVENFVFSFIYKIFYNVKVQMAEQELLKKHFPDMPPLKDIANNISLVITNTHVSLFGAQAMTPNLIEAGGFFIADSKKLDQDLDKFISDAPHGVVYVSFGSMVKASSMPQDKVDAFLAAFSQLKQRVLWKWENESLPGAPPNLLTKKWMPQIDILSHKNVKAFISHGGMLGTTEAIHTGVPMLTIPLFGDQFANAASVRESGLGVTLQFEDITKESVLAALNTLLEPKMYANAKRLSQIWHDRPMSPMDTAIYWIEYVARYQGAPHLRSAAVDLPLYQYLLLDVIAFLGAITLIVLYVNYQILKLLLRLCCGSSKSKNPPEKTKTKKTKKEN